MDIMALKGWDIMKRCFSAIFISALLLVGKSWCASGGAEDTLRATKAWKAMQSRVQINAYSEDNIRMLQDFIRAFPQSEYISDARFAIAEIYFRESKYKEAWPQYKILMGQKDNIYSDDISLRLGEIQYNTGHINTAREYWEKIAGKSWGGSILAAEAQYYLILCDLREKDYMSASNNLDLLFQRYPTYKDLPKVRELTGIIRFQEKNFNKALEALEDITTPAAEFYRGLCYFQLKQYLEAAECFKKLASDSKSGYAEMGAYLKAESFRLGGNNNLAAHTYGEFVNAYRDSQLRPYAFVQLSRTLMNSKRYDKALEVLKIAMETPGVSKNVTAYAMYLQAATYGKTGDYRRAISIIDSALKLIRKDDYPELFGSIFVDKGYYLLKQGDSANAALAMKELVQEMPYHPLGMVACMIMGNAAYMDKNWNSAITSYEAALLKYKYTELSDVAMAMLLRTYYTAGKYSELVTNANRVMKVVISEFTAKNDLWRSYSYFLLAEAYYKIEQYSKASEYYQKAGRHPAWAPLSKLYLAWALYHEGKYSEASSLAKQVVASSENTPMGRASAGFLSAACFFNQKQYDSAIGAFRSFRTRFPQDSHVPESYLQEGIACRLALYFKDALRVWEQLVKLYPEDPSSQEAQINIGRLYFQGRQYDSAVQAFGILLKKWPRTSFAAEAQWMMAQSYYNSKKYAESIPVYEAFLNEHPKDSRVEACKAQLMLAYYNRAISTKDPRFLAHFVHTYPESTLASEAQYMIGFIAYTAQKWAVAVTEMRRMLLNYPGAPQASMALLAVARAQEHLNNIPDAIVEYESVLTMFPTTTYAQDAAMRLGAIYFTGGRFGEAAEKFTFLASHSPEGQVKMDAVYNMAVSYSRERDFGNALRAYESFADNYEDDPRQIDALLEIANINKNNDDYQRTLDTYQRILESKNPKSTPVLRMQLYTQIGEIYLKTANDQKKAIVAYSQLIPMKPYNNESRLLGLAQLAALYEANEDWGNAQTVYKQIASSGGRADWVKTAVDRSKEIKEYLKAKSVAPVAAPVQKADIQQPEPEPEQASVSSETKKE